LQNYDNVFENPVHGVAHGDGFGSQKNPAVGTKPL